MKQQHCIFIPDDNYELKECKAPTPVISVVTFLTTLLTCAVITAGILIV